MIRLILIATISFAVFACGPPDVDDLRAIGKVVITNASSRVVEVKRIEIGGSTFSKTVAPSSTVEELFTCEKRSILPDKCIIRWQLQNPKEDSKEMVIDLRSLNKSPIGGYELTLDSTFSWSASAIPLP